MHSALACTSKESAATCFFRGHGDSMTKSDLTNTVNTYLPFYLRWGFNAFGGVGRVMKDCDENKDGKITREEAIHSQSCMDTCEKRDNIISYLGC